MLLTLSQLLSFFFSNLDALERKVTGLTLIRSPNLTNLPNVIPTSHAVRASRDTRLFPYLFLPPHRRRPRRFSARPSRSTPFCPGDRFLEPFLPSTGALSRPLSSPLSLRWLHSDPAPAQKAVAPPSERHKTSLPAMHTARLG